MLEKEITFDRFIRGGMVAAGVVLLGLLLNRLSSVLLPFFVAWLMAYMLYPLVHFLQVKCRLRNRVLSIFVAVLLVVGVLTAALAIVVPPTVREFGRLSGLIASYMHGTLAENAVLREVQYFLQTRVDERAIMNILQQGTFIDTMKNVLAETWSLVASTINFAIGLLGVFVILLYMFFILMDYETISEGWVKFIPKRSRAFATGVVGDVERGMNAYFRGQALVALCVGILFSIGFLIIDFPMAIGLGMFIGLLNMVPYLQLIGFVPTILLALLKAADTGQNFWVILLCALVVFAVVQVIQDMYLTPRIMGHVMGLNPAIILLALSVWGSLLGLIGFIIALPLTTLIISYYKRFVLKDDAEATA